MDTAKTKDVNVVENTNPNNKKSSHVVGRDFTIDQHCVTLTLQKALLDSTLLEDLSNYRRASFNRTINHSADQQSGIQTPENSAPVFQESARDYVHSALVLQESVRSSSGLDLYRQLHLVCSWHFHLRIWHRTLSSSSTRCRRSYRSFSGGRKTKRVVYRHGIFVFHGNGDCHRLLIGW